MELEKLPYELTICKISDVKDIDLSEEFFFLGRTDQEISLVCRSENVPGSTLKQDDGWCGFRICGELEFSLTGVLARLSGILAEEKIAIFAVSTYNTDYILIKKENIERAMAVLHDAGYEIVQ